MNYLCVGHDFGVINMRSQAYITEACQPWNLSYSEYVTLMTLYDSTAPAKASSVTK